MERRREMLRGGGGDERARERGGETQGELDWRIQGRGAMATRKRKKKGTAGVVGHNHNSPHSKKNSKNKYDEKEVQAKMMMMP